MSIKVYSVVDDNVINSYVAMASTNYEYAMKNFYPLICRLDIQRKIQDKKFYKKLERDILDGCIMPPITFAMIDDPKAKFDLSSLQKYVNENVEKGFILDGIQRLNTLQRASESENFNPKTLLYVNIIICNSEDKLLYRMITLNNGQRPMTPRHQVEILTANAFNFKKLGIPIQTEKERAERIIRNSFNKGDFVRGYLGFITDSVNIENDKIIDSKMNDLLVSKIMDNEPKNYDIKFEDIATLIGKYSKDNELFNWFKNTNNLIGFCVGVKKTYKILAKLKIDEFKNNVETFENAFKSLNPSKIKLGKYRRELLSLYLGKFKEYCDYDEDQLLEVFADEIE